MSACFQMPHILKSFNILMIKKFNGKQYPKEILTDCCDVGIL